MTALITGASGGIGYELAGVLAAQGHDLVLVARRQGELQRRADELSQKFNIRASVIAMDLAVPGSSSQLVREIEAGGVQIDCLINNAGFAVRGAFDCSDIDRQLQLLRLNIETLTHLSRLLIPSMHQRGSGKILNIASIASLMPGPWMATYFASKAYVLSFSQALSAELAGTGVSVTALIVGPTRSDFAANCGAEQTKAFRGKVMESRDVARLGYQAMMRGQRVAYAGWINRFRALPAKFVPTRVLTYFAGKYHELPDQQQ